MSIAVAIAATTTSPAAMLATHFPPSMIAGLRTTATVSCPLTLPRISHIERAAGLRLSKTVHFTEFDDGGCELRLAAGMGPGPDTGDDPTEAIK
jgi:hypothetical protein